MDFALRFLRIYVPTSSRLQFTALSANSPIVPHITIRLCGNNLGWKPLTAEVAQPIQMESYGRTLIFLVRNADTVDQQ